jgi:hypothetical protein
VCDAFRAKVAAWVCVGRYPNGFDARYYRDKSWQRALMEVGRGA